MESPSCEPANDVYPITEESAAVAYCAAGYVGVIEEPESVTVLAPMGGVWAVCMPLAPAADGIAQPGEPVSEQMQPAVGDPSLDVLRSW